MKEITLNGKTFVFSNAELVEKSSTYDLELVEIDFDPKTAKKIAGGVDTRLTLPEELERTITRTSLLPVAKVFQDQNGKKKLTAYFD